VALAVGLGVAACGGDDGESVDSFTGETDTGDLLPVDTGVTEEPPAPPPTVTEETPGETIQIAVPKAGESIGPQSPAARVAELQEALIVLGFKIGEPDGIYGGKTVNAVKRFQKKQKLQADGLVGPKTARAINKALRQQAAGEST
jgi:peptidoglycan hydrolase-like protein with peptidoglycan-binding domain